MAWKLVNNVSLPGSVQDWVADTGSLTQRCINAFGKNYHLKLLSEEWGYPNLLEQDLLELSPKDTVKIREIFLCNGNTPVVFGHSIFPESILKNDELNLNTLGTQSLGRQLFSHPNCHRSDIFVAQITRETELFQAATKNNAVDLKKLWARYSVFSINHSKLMVYEVFFLEPV